MFYCRINAIFYLKKYKLKMKMKLVSKKNQARKGLLPKIKVSSKLKIEGNFEKLNTYFF